MTTAPRCWRTRRPTGATIDLVDVGCGAAEQWLYVVPDLVVSGGEQDQIDILERGAVRENRRLAADLRELDPGLQLHAPVGDEL